ncbi:MAG: hypothetical protein ACI9IA_000117 [Enterobacterales bacterium]|jgi:hypothetical protein
MKQESNHNILRDKISMLNMNSNTFSLFIKTCLTFLVMIFQVTLYAIDWPQEIEHEKGKIIIYQPQPEKFEGNVLYSRSAMALELKGKKEPIFGVFWFKAQVDTNHETNTATVRDIEVQKVRWPESKDAGEQEFTSSVNAALSKTGFEISLEQLSASLAAVEQEKNSLAELKNDAPNLIFKENLAVLLSYDGKPIFTEIDNSNYKRAVNSPFLVIESENSSNYYLSSGELWYTASSATGPWKQTYTPPAVLLQMLQKTDSNIKVSKVPENLIPEIVVSTTASELIVTTGKPTWESTSDGELLYVKNTETPWLRNTKTGNMYVLLAGRWFRSKTSSGPWIFVRADELPKSFAKISPASPIGGIRTSVAGTEEAEEAILDAKIPKTAAIKRSEAKLTVEYNGAPKFKSIPGTDITYAENTASQVLFIGKQYFAVDNGVWFVATTPSGPWKVADEIPEDEIAKIPPSSPVYNTKYVHVYHSTADVVYVGYTPGYRWSYPYYGVPVYGTGWYYPPYYYGGVYYPRTSTWGLSVGYNSYTGWTYGMSWSNGFLSVGVAWGGHYGGHYGGYYGGHYRGGHHGPVIINNGNINIGNNINVGNRDKIANKLSNNPNFNKNNLKNSDIYKRAGNTVRNADRDALNSRLNKAKQSSDRRNNVYSDRDGNLSRRVEGKWQNLDKGKWNNAPSLNNVNKRKSNSSRSRSKSGNRNRDLNRDFKARQSGRTRQARSGGFKRRSR